MIIIAAPRVSAVVGVGAAVGAVSAGSTVTATATGVSVVIGTGATATATTGASFAITTTGAALATGPLGFIVLGLPTVEHEIINNLLADESLQSCDHYNIGCLNYADYL